MWLVSLGFGFGKTRAVRCYVTLLVWIILVSLSLYWFLNRNSNESIWTQKRWAYKKTFSSNEIDENNEVVKKIRWRISKKFPKSNVEASTTGSSPFLHASVHRLCNHPGDIRFEDENLQVPEFKLDAIATVFRHGDRGPLSHVGSQNLSLVDCSTNMPEFQKFFRFSQDSMHKMSGYSQFIGPFHSFSKVPTVKECLLGQLSQLGAGQHIQLGKAMQSAYKSTLFNSATSSPLPETSNTTMTNHPLQNIRVVAYSTRYRRTLQSLLAFLYGLMGPKYIIPNVSIRESQSITFCFNDCSCRATERLKKVAAKKYQPSPHDKAKMISLIDRVNGILGSEKTKKSGTTLLDLLLVYSCHHSELPCQSKSSKKASGLSEECVGNDDVSSLIHLLQKENHDQKKITANRQLYLLTSYGLLKEIVNLALKMTSSNAANTLDSSVLNNTPLSNTNGYINLGIGRTKVAIFSGHDTTLQSLTGALGIFTSHPDIHLVPYASRLIFEFYRKTNVPPNSARKHYFRVIYNGQAVTHLIKFCVSDNVVLPPSGTGHDDKATLSPGYQVLCPLENLVRFLHDHYFESFGNATNFKDACLKTGKKKKK